MQIKVIGTALIVTSSLKKSEVDLAKVYAPDALTQRDENGCELFKISTGKQANISNFGATFNGTNTDGNLQATIVIPDAENADAKLAFVKKEYGVALTNLVAAEEIIAAEIATKVTAINATFAGADVE